MDNELKQFLKDLKNGEKGSLQQQDDLIVEYLKSHLENYKLYDIYGIKEILLDLLEY
jgi:hypothetical protein